MPKSKMVTVSAVPRGGYYRGFDDIPRADAEAAGLRANQYDVVSAGYPEVQMSVDSAREHATMFPTKCPACGAQCVSVKRIARVPAYQRTAVYECGGAYTSKPQMQNHTEKWWGHCPQTKLRIATLLRSRGIDVED